MNRGGVFPAPHPHAGASQLLADVSPDVVDGHRLQLLVALDLLVDGALTGSQLPVGAEKREGFLEDDMTKQLLIITTINNHNNNNNNES